MNALSIIIPALILGFIFGWCITATIADKYWQNWLVDNGYAEYYLDENNNRQWRMKEKKK